VIILIQEYLLSVYADKLAQLISYQSHIWSFLRRKR